MATQWDTVALALTDLMRATAGYRAPESTLTGVPVYFGPEYGIDNTRLISFLSVGWSGDPDNPESSGSITQTAGPMAPTRPRDETGTILCRAVYADGNANDAAMRAGLAACRQIVADVETVTRADPTLGLAQPTMKWAFVTDGAPTLEFAGGVHVFIDFTVTYEARL